METLDIGGVTYKKAAAVAKDLGYTADYVGQLCRSGKVTAQLVGRSWYVDVSSIGSHKENRYRSSVEKSKQAVRQVVAAQKSNTSMQKPTNYLRFAVERPGSIKVGYATDEADLIPGIDKPKKMAPEIPSGNLEVVHADAEKLAIKSSGGQYQITTTQRPKISFSGSLDVVSHDDESYIEQEATDVSQAEEPLALQSKKSKEKPAVKKIQRKPVAVPPKKAIRTSDQRVRTVTILDASHSSAMSGKFVFFVLTNAFIVAFVVFAFGVSFTSTVIASKQSVQIAYSIEVPALGAQLIDPLK